MTRLLAVLLAVLAIAATAGPAQAAAPRIVIVSGKPLAHRIAIANWHAIFVVVSDVSNGRVAPRKELAGRPRLRLSLFWGPGWNDFLDAGGRATSLRPSQADQVGWLYPARRGRPALIDLPWAGRWPRAVPARARAMLGRYGVPLGHR